MTAPDFVAQTAEPKTGLERRSWFVKHADEFRAKGATFFQYSVDVAHNPYLCLVEGWKVQPNPQPAAHFQRTPA